MRLRPPGRKAKLKRLIVSPLASLHCEKCLWRAAEPTYLLFAQSWTARFQQSLGTDEMLSSERIESRCVDAVSRQ